MISSVVIPLMRNPTCRRTLCKCTKNFSKVSSIGIAYSKFSGNLTFEKYVEQSDVVQLHQEGFKSRYYKVLHFFKSQLYRLVIWEIS